MQPTPEQWARLLDGSHSEQDWEVLRHWLAEDETNLRVWEDYQQLWRRYGERAVAFIQQNPPRTDLAWQRLQQDMQGAPAVLVRRRMAWQVRAVAAAVALLVALGGWWLWQQQESRVVATTATHQHTLPDGSVVTLRQGSQLRYARRFDRDHRRLYLQGEAFFDVQRDENLPFIVQADAGMVEVLGTSFLVEAGSSDSLLLTVYTGVTALSPAGAVQGRSRVAAGQSAVSTLRGVTFRHFQAGRLAWKTGRLQHQAAPLAEVISDLEHWYGVRIRCENRALLPCPITIALEDEQVEVALATVAALFGMQLEAAGEDAFLLQGGHCNE